jgi:outer membrane protein OmpA-like peptidoglycan-associated protein
MLENMKGELENAHGALAQTQGALEATKGALASTQGDLERMRAIANARKQLAAGIQDAFAKAGVKASVDGKTGEVTLDFGEEYFDTGSTTLKPKMKVALDKFIPIYARSLFSNPKIADKIANVEIVGFASSTYKGRYVNPKSVKPEDRDAVDYNLKLSFGRANSIFNHVLNKNTLTQKEQEKLLPMLKVVGRGYLPEGRDPASIPDGISEREFCKQFNCKKAQRVIVKFNMKD